MKKIIFAFAAMFIFAAASNAAITLPEQSQTIVSQKAKYVIDLGDITNKSEKAINEEVATYIASIEDDDLECEVTLKGTVKIFFFSVEFSVTVKGSCEEMLTKGINVSGLVMNAVRNRLLSM